MDDRQIKKGVAKHIIVIVLLTLLGVAVLVDTVIGGNILFYAKWVECGRKPVQLGRGWYEKGRTPYVDPDAIHLTRGNHHYACTEAEARRRGCSEP